MTSSVSSKSVSFIETSYKFKVIVVVCSKIFSVGLESVASVVKIESVLLASGSSSVVSIGVSLTSTSAIPPVLTVSMLLSMVFLLMMKPLMTVVDPEGVVCSTASSTTSSADCFAADTVLNVLELSAMGVSSM